MHSSRFPGKLAFALGAAIVATTVGLAGPLEPPPGPITSTGRFGPRVDVLTLPGDATATRIISQPGSYYLSANLVGESGKSGIRIENHQVTLDLGGFALLGVNGSLHGITWEVADDVSILSGTITRWGMNGIRGVVSANVRIRDVNVHVNGGTGMAFDDGLSGLSAIHVAIDHCLVRGNGGHGIVADNWVLVEHSIIGQNAGDGIVIHGAASIQDNVVAYNGGTGVRCNEACLVRGNVVEFNTGNINAPGSTVIENQP